jgi:hypothetical protein
MMAVARGEQRTARPRLHSTCLAAGALAELQPEAAVDQSLQIDEPRWLLPAPPAADAGLLLICMCISINCMPLHDVAVCSGVNHQHTQ